MRSDRYLKIILTVIAVELLWLGVRDLAPTVSAQAQAGAQRVIVAGVDLPRDSAFVPVAIVGSYTNVPGEYRDQIQPATVRVSGAVNVVSQAPLRITADRPLKIEADRPLLVEQVPYKPGLTPGE